MRKYAILIVLIAILFANAYYYISTLKFVRNSFINNLRTDYRYSNGLVNVSDALKIKKDLPKDVKVVSYLANGDMSNRKVEEWFSFQWALVPIFVTGYEKQPLLILDFRDENLDEEVLKQYDVELIKNYGNGLFLVRDKVLYND